MMKKNLTFKKLICFALLLMLLLQLYSCGGAGETGTTEATTEEITTAAAVKINYADGSYNVVRPDEANTSVVEAGKNVKKAIDAAYGTNLTITSDWLKPGDNPEAHEILVGNTNREETKTVKAEAANGSYVIRFVGDKLVIYGTSDLLLADAVAYFIEKVIPLGQELDSSFCYIHADESIKISKLTVLGSDISDCGYVLKNSDLSAGAESLVSYISEATGVTVEQVKSTDAAPVKLLFTHMLNDKAVAYDDYAISIDGNNLVISAGGKFASRMASAYLINNYLSKGGNVEISGKSGDVLYEYRMLDRDAYISNPSLLPMHWSDTWTPSANLLDYQEKKDTLMQTNTKHVFTVSHRGDFLFYPENSIESYISVWAMGGDCVETDIHFTADGVCVIMHDATLTRMTNVADYMGKGGYPDTANIADWTYEQLKVLCLKEGQGGSNAAITPYKIPTLEEVLKVAKNRFFLILDKASGWRYVDIDGIMPESANNFIYPIMKKAGNFESVLISYGTVGTSASATLDASEAIKIQKYVHDNDGVDMFFFLRCWTTRNTVESYAKTFYTGSLTNVGLLVNGAFDPTNQSVINEVKNIKKKYSRAFIGGWTIDSNGYDKAETWDLMYNTGYRSIMTNNMFGLVQWAATKK